VVQGRGRQCGAQLSQAPFPVRAVGAVGEVVFDLETADQVQFAIDERVEQVLDVSALHG
jgi:hypothetical protein